MDTPRGGAPPRAPPALRAQRNGPRATAGPLIVVCSWRLIIAATAAAQAPTGPIPPEVFCARSQAPLFRTETPSPIAYGCTLTANAAMLCLSGTSRQNELERT